MWGLHSWKYDRLHSIMLFMYKFSKYNAYYTIFFSLYYFIGKRSQTSRKSWNSIRYYSEYKET